ncbi:putative transposase [Wolbachia endosymbiont of Armadillidium vulgare str. wVulC]|nr:putative transposase [Wolbachia endosymbiont of Armadillidium vulgare str. wVulC]
MHYTFLNIPCVSTAHKKLNIKINDCRVDKNNMEDIEIAIDSTNL